MPAKMLKETTPREAAVGADLREDDYERLARTFRALGHRTRLAILLRIAKGEFCVGDLQEHLDRSQSNISQHLAVLRDRGLIVAERRGNNVCYNLADKRIARIIEVASEMV